MIKIDLDDTEDGWNELCIFPLVEGHRDWNIRIVNWIIYDMNKFLGGRMYDGIIVVHQDWKNYEMIKQRVG